LLEDIGGDLDQEAVERAPVPFCENPANLWGGQPRTFFIRSYASQIICMSPYSIPLCTIFT